MNNITYLTAELIPKAFNLFVLRPDRFHEFHDSIRYASTGITMTIYAATQNANKLKEFRTICQPYGISVAAANELAPIPEIAEDYSTFEENAIHKALTVASIIGRVTFSDDSGLEVFTLNGEPGVHSARYAGPGATDREKMEKLLHRLSSHTDRGARFVCVIAVASPAGVIGTANGEVRGVIAKSASGTNGFGYDPIFIPESHRQTLAELTAPCKDAISHRGAAMRNAIAMGLFQD